MKTSDRIFGCIGAVLAGIPLIVFANASNMPDLFQIAGAILIFIGIAAMPWRKSAGQP